MNIGIIAIAYFSAGIVAAFMGVFMMSSNAKEELKKKLRIDISTNDKYDISTNVDVSLGRDFTANEAYDLALAYSSAKFDDTYDINSKYDKGTYRIKSVVSVTITKMVE